MTHRHTSFILPDGGNIFLSENASRTPRLTAALIASVTTGSMFCSVVHSSPVSLRKFASRKMFVRRFASDSVISTTPGPGLLAGDPESAYIHRFMSRSLRSPPPAQPGIARQMACSIGFRLTDTYCRDYLLTPWLFCQETIRNVQVGQGSSYCRRFGCD